MCILCTPESVKLGVAQTCRQAPGQREWCGWSDGSHPAWFFVMGISIVALLVLFIASVFFVRAIRVSSNIRRPVYQELFNKAKWFSLAACKFEYPISHASKVNSEGKGAYCSVSPVWIYSIVGTVDMHVTRSNGIIGKCQCLMSGRAMIPRHQLIAEHCMKSSWAILQQLVYK